MKMATTNNIDHTKSYSSENHVGPPTWFFTFRFNFILMHPPSKSVKINLTSSFGGGITDE